VVQENEVIILILGIAVLAASGDHCITSYGGFMGGHYNRCVGKGKSWSASG